MINKTLYKRTSTGKIQQWNVEVIRPKGYWNNGISELIEHARIIYTYGQQDGKQQVKEVVYKFGKNLGKSNETTPYEQAVLDAESDIRKKITSGYIEDISRIDDVDEIPKPMLAHEYLKHSSKVEKYDYVYMQTKLDGCVSGDTIVEFKPAYSEGTGVLFNKEIREIVDNRLWGSVKSFNTQTNQIEYRVILDWAKDIQEEQSYKWYKIELEDGRTLKVTGNHLIYLPELQCYRRVNKLIGDEVLLVD